MYRATKREKTMIGVAVAAIVLMCLYIFIYQPKKKETLRLREEIKGVDLRIEKIVRGIPGLEESEEEVIRVQRRLSLVEKTISGGQQVLELLRQLAREAYRLNMDVISLEPKEELPPEKAGYKRLTVVMNIQCAYRHLGLYLRGLIDLPGLVTVDELQVVRNRETFPKLQVKLTLSTFVSCT
jgi:Tfp pilus assembly protein PilO